MLSRPGNPFRNWEEFLDVQSTMNAMAKLSIDNEFLGYIENNGEFTRPGFNNRTAVRCMHALKVIFLGKEQVCWIDVSYRFANVIVFVL